MERIVIVAYRPLPGKEKELSELMKTHWEILDGENLVSARKPIIMQSSNGTMIEVFGWKSKAAIESAHTNSRVQKMWGDFAKVCEFVPVGDVEESKVMFSEFTPA